MSDSEMPKRTVDHTLEARQEAELLRETLIAGLAAAASDLSSVAQDLLHSSTITRVQRTGLALVLGLMMVLLAINGFGVFETYKNSSESRRNGDVIRSCTTPEGECYKANLKRSSGVVKNINDIVVAAASCARLTPNGTEDEIRACVVKTLAN